MAGWRLTSAHYISVEGIEWEHKETTQEGRMYRKVYPVPLYLNPDDPTTQTPPGSGITIVCDKFDARYPKAYIFSGPPTIDMEPLDDEARAISEPLAAKWQHPIDSLPGDFSQALITEFERRMADIRAGAATAPPPAISTGSVGPDEFKQLMEQMKSLQDEVLTIKQENAELRALAPEPEDIEELEDA